MLQWVCSILKTAIIKHMHRVKASVSSSVTQFLWKITASSFEVWSSGDSCADTELLTFSFCRPRRACILSCSESNSNMREAVTVKEQRGPTLHNSCFAEAGSYEMTNQHVKQNGKLEDNPATGSPPRTTLLGTIFSPVFNFFSPANKNGKQCLEACSRKAKNDDFVFCSVF